MAIYAVTLRYTLEVLGTVTIRARSQEAAQEKADTIVEGITSLAQFEKTADDTDYEVDQCTVEEVEESND